MTKISNELEGLTALLETAFPKKCAVCGREYRTAQQFLEETEDLPTVNSCLKESIEDDGTAVVEVFRNCVCGSTLMDEFSDRRDTSEKGQQRREQFERLLKLLIDKGINQQVARVEMLKLMRGKKSHVIDKILIKNRPLRDGGK